MSTRSSLVFIGPGVKAGEKRAIRIYRHYDGYPTEILLEIGDVFHTALEKFLRGTISTDEAFAEKLEQFESTALDAEDLALIYDRQYNAPELSCHGDHSIKNVAYDGPAAPMEGASLEEAFGYPTESASLEEVFGSQCDLEWLYVIDGCEHTVKVYGGGYKDKPAWKLVENGVVNPLGYVDCLYEEFQQTERKEIENGMKEIEVMGFRVNPDA